MSETTEKPDEIEADAPDGEEGAAEKPKRSIVKLALMAAPVLLLAIGGGAAWQFGLFGGGGEAGGQAVAAPKPAFFYNMPEMLVNLNQADKRAQYLKIKVSLEMADENITSALEPVLPRIMDTFQIYLRELRSEDLDGSAGVYRLKEELLRRVNLAIAPAEVDRVLFKEIIVQ